MKNAYVVKVFDHTLKRKGEVVWTMIDEDGNPVKHRINQSMIANGNTVGRDIGYWRTRKALVDEFDRINDGFYQVAGSKEVHQNYRHWAGLEF